MVREAIEDVLRAFTAKVKKRALERMMKREEACALQQ